MTFSDLAFWVLSVLLVGSALAVVLSKNLFHAVLWLALALTGTAGVFLLLNAEFLAAVQLLLYAGGIVTVVVFAIVVTERLIGQRLSQTNRGIGSGALISAGLLAVIVSTLMQREFPSTPLPQMNEQRRKELVKVVHKYAEDGKVAVRHARTHARDALKKLTGVSEDDVKHGEKDVQKIHDDYIHKIDELIKAKEAEIMEV